MSLSSVVMLDLTLKAVSDGPRHWVEFRPHFKPTSLQVPLSTQSFHHWNIHTAWPFNQIRRFAMLSSSRTAYEAAKQLLVQRFVDAGEPRSLVDSLRLYNPWTSSKSTDACEQLSCPRKLWLVIPYHPVWASSGLCTAISKYVLSPFATVLWSKCFSCEPRPVGLAWKNNFPPSHSILTQFANLDWVLAGRREDQQ